MKKSIKKKLKYYFWKDDIIQEALKNGWETSPAIWIPKEKYHLDQDLRETDEINGENKGLIGDEIEEIVCKVFIS